MKTLHPAAKFYSASHAGLQLARPTSQILRAIRTLDLDASRAGNSKSAAILLTADDLGKIESFLTATTTYK